MARHKWSQSEAAEMRIWKSVVESLKADKYIGDRLVSEIVYGCAEQEGYGRDLTRAMVSGWITGSNSVFGDYRRWVAASVFRHESERLKECDDTLRTFRSALSSVLRGGAK